MSVAERVSFSGHETFPFRYTLGRAKDLKVFLQFRPDEGEIDRQYEHVSRCWDALLKAVPVLREAPERMRSHEVPDPNPDGYRDHLLFWPIGQEMFAQVARALLDAGEIGDDCEAEGMTDVLAPLAKVPWDLNESPWRHLLLVSASDDEGWRIRSEDRKPAVEVAGRIVRWVVGLDALGGDEVDKLRGDWRALLYPEPPEASTIEAMWESVVGARAAILTGSAGC